MKNYFVGNIFALLSLMVTNVEAQETDVVQYHQYVQDVFQSEPVYPQEKNEFQFTLVPQFQQTGGFDSFMIPFDVEFGLTDSWQVSAGINSFRQIVPLSGPSVNGTGDIRIGTQYSFMNIGNTGFHAAVGFELGVPFRKGNSDYSNGLVSYEPYLSIAADLPKFHQLNLFASTGFEFFRQDNNLTDEELTEFNLNAGFLFPCKFMVLTSEFSLNTNKLSGGDEAEFYYTPGLIFNLPGRWETGLGVPVGLNKQSDNFGIIGMVIFEFNVSGEDD